MNRTKTLAPRLNPQTAPRARRMDHNTVARPKRRKPATSAPGAAETVEKYVARGGHVQRLMASWEETA